MAFFLALPALFSTPVVAAETDLADSPQSSASNTVIKPNILFILDDSGSMNWKFMPDDLSAAEERIGFRNHRCNLVYYNPEGRYVTPMTSTGADINSGVPTAFTAAYNDGYGAYYGWETRTSANSGTTWTAWSTAASCTEDTSGTSRRQCRVALLGSAGATTNLSTGFRAFVNDAIENNSVTTKVDTAQPAYYWKYLGAQALLPEVGDCRKQVSPSFTVNGATYSSGVATFRTSAAHNFLVGQTVGVINIKPTGYRGVFTVTAVPDTTHFKVALATNPGGYTSSGSAWNGTEYATIKEFCTDDTRTTSTCAALGKTALWRKVVVSATSGPATTDINGDSAINASDADERQNFANWYSYYSNRMRTMKAAAGRAFVGMTDSKRIGFLTINPNSPVSAKKYTAVGSFDTAHKAEWFNLLYSQTTNGSTPLREALSRAGRYFANKTNGINTGMSDDPVQYSCQQNFSILTTDGYWNSEGGLKLDGTTDMDNQDGVISELDAYRPSGSKFAMAPRPIYDGASTTYTWNAATIAYSTASCPLQEKKTFQVQSSSGGHWEEESTQFQEKTGQLQWSTNLQVKTGQLQYKSKLQMKTGQLEFSTNQQVKTGQLQYQSKVQSKTGQLQFATNQQSRTGQLQFATNQQTRTGQLEFSTTLQRMTGQLQYDSRIQHGTGQLWRNTSNDAGDTWNGWTMVSTCQEDFSGSNRTWCYVVVATWTYVSACDATRTGTVNEYFWTGGSSTVDCRTVATSSGWTDTGACTEISGTVGCRVNGAWSYVTTYAPSCSPTRSGSSGSYVWSGASAVDCRTEPSSTFNPTWTATATCTESASVRCQVSPSATVAYVTTYPGTCTPSRTGSSGSYAWTGGAAAVDCQTAASFNTNWNSVANCTEGAITQCRVSPSATVAYVTTYPGTCTPTRTGSSGSYAWTGGAAAVDCQTAGSFNPAWTNNAVCLEGAITQCRVNAAWVKAQSCSPTRNASAPYSWTGDASAVDCQTLAALDGTWTNVTAGTCSESSNVACQIGTGSWNYVTTYPGTCLPSRSGSAGSYVWTATGVLGASTVNCQTAGSFNPAWTAASSCDTGAITQCRVNGSWVKTQSCTPTRNASAPYNWYGNASAVDCQNTGVLDATWTNIAGDACTESSDIACQINASWGHVATYPPTCTPTRSGSAGAYAWTGGASAIDCQTAGFNPTWTNRATCNESASVACRVNDLSPTGVATCTPTRSGSAGAYAWTGDAAAVDCNTVVTAAYHTVPYACTPSPINASGDAINCQFVGGGPWINADADGCADNATTRCQTIVLSDWAANNICVANPSPNSSGQINECRNAGTNGFKLRSTPTTTATTWSGPDQSGTTLGAATVVTGTAFDTLTGACYASSPALPATHALIGAGPPAPPDNCTNGQQVWPCETYSAGAGSLTASISALAWTAPGEDPVIDPATATITTSAAHPFLVGHSVTISGANPSGYRGNYQIIDVADPTHFKVLMPTNYGAYTGSGTASLFSGSSNSVADVAQYYYKTDLRTSALGNCTGSLGTDVCDNNVRSTGSGVEDDRANWQHMTTFTMGMGLTGTVVYSPNYRTDQCVAKSIASATWSAGGYATVTTTDAHGFYPNESITIAGGTNGAYRGQFRVYDVPSSTTFKYVLSANPGGAFGTGTVTGCPDFDRIRSGNLNWPVPTAGGRTALDDLWHAAVNGRGQYFSAGDPESVVSGLSTALTGISARVGAAAAAATSNLEPVAGDNFAYTAKYKTQAWTGDLEAREINLETGAVGGTVIWSAQAKLDAQTKSDCDNRNIKLFRNGATDNLVSFTWGTYACNAAGARTGSSMDDLDPVTERIHFDAGEVMMLSHYANLGDGTGATVDQRTPAAGANLLNFLRGQRGKEGFSSGPPITNTDLNKLYRTREHVLGDIVNAQPVFVKGPFADYDDIGYAAYKSGAAANRTPTVYASANDGMLHAFNAGTSIVDTNGGTETWAFVPTLVLPNLYKLASENYNAHHVYSVDGTPSVGDVYDPPSSTAATAAATALAEAASTRAAATTAAAAATAATATAIAAVAEGTPAAAAAAAAAASAASTAATAATAAATAASAAATAAAATPAAAAAANSAASAATAAAAAASAASTQPTAAATATATATAVTAISTATAAAAAAPEGVAAPRWKTILVSGLNKGGKGYYALDITDPSAPKGLWEFKHNAGNCVTVDPTTKAPATDEYSDCHIGYSFNNPIISKLADDRWVVFVTSGYNNVNSPSAPGDGVGYLYVLEAMTGKILYKIETNAGDSTTPSGLNHIAGWVNGSATRNNKTDRIYGVDLLGNVWRFDVNGTLNAAGREATLVTQVVDPGGVGQPITTRPELAKVSNDAFVYVGTGRYLGDTDAADHQRQSIWAIRDTLSDTALADPRGSLRQMTVVNHGSGTSAYRTISCTAQCGSGDGWYADLPDTGERVNIDMKLQLGTLVVASNVPETNACNIGGYAWLNYFNNASGEAISNSADHAVGRRLVGTGGQESLAVGLNIVRLPGGKTVVIATTSAAEQLTVEAPFDVAPPTGKRVSWREIIQ
jgi:Tfp pilus tip-associated adhesin PilY1